MGTQQSTGNADSALQRYAATAGQFAADAPHHIQAATDIANASADVYRTAMKHVAEARGGTPGAGVFGGDEETPAVGLKDYQSSLAALTKDRLIRGLARALKSAGIRVDPDASPDQIAKTLVAALPNPRAGKTIATDKKQQDKTCRLVAKALNDEFTPGEQHGARALVDTKLGTVGICRKVSEIAHGLVTGLHGEFLEVHADLTRVLKNLTALEEVLRRSHAHIVQKAAEESGGDIDPGLEELYQRALSEHKRQLLMLSHLVNVSLASSKDELGYLMETENEERNIIQELKLVPGSSDLSDALAYAVSGLGTTAAMSAMVDKALREVGIEVSKYLQSADMKAFQALLDARLDSGDIPTSEIGKFLAQAQVLKQHFAGRDKLELPAASVSDRLMATESKFGGASDSRSKKIDRRVKAQKVERKLMVSDFIARAGRHYSAFLKSAETIGPKLGRSIPLSDNLAHLREALARLQEGGRLGMMNLELALIGYHGDADARNRKESFLAALRNVLGALEALQADPAYSGSIDDFASMADALRELIKTVDFYSDAFARKHGAAEESSTDAAATGGNDDDVGSIPEIARSALSLARAVNSFFYYFYMAKVRENLKQTSTELKHYGEDYGARLGNAVSARLRLVEADEKKRVDDLKTAGVTGDELKRCTEFLKKQTKHKKNLYRVLQAVDLYMKAFTSAVTNHPDEVMKSMRRALDGVAQIAPWYSEITGDKLVAAFDQAPGAHDAATNDSVYSDIQSQPGAHYYEKLASSTERNGLFIPGVPLNSIPMDRASRAASEISDAVDQFQALKNIINTFTRIGDRFGDTELHGKLFMSPSQIFSALTDYIKGSSLSLHTAADHTDGGPPLTTTTKRGQVYFSSVGRSDYETEDRYFTHCVLAMVSKVFTTIGVFDLFNRPSPIYDLTPTRMIIGGDGFDTVPEIVPEAAELYFRLLRLAEFYQVLFEMDPSQATQISMLPEVEGTFSGLVRLLFVQINPAAVKSGNYSDMEIRAIIREINAIHQSAKSGGKSVADVLSDFVSEINRRYGVVKSEDYMKIRNLLRTRGAKVDSRTLNTTNYAILPGEGEFETDRRAPADRYGELTSASKPDISPDEAIDGDNSWANWTTLSEFRKKLDGFFASVSPEEFTSFSFSTLIRQAQGELSSASDRDARYSIASRLIRGEGGLAGIDVGKSFMFHETVVVGLNLLGGIHAILDSAAARVSALNVKDMRDRIRAFLQRGPGAVDQKAIRGEIAVEVGNTDRDQYVRDGADNLSIVGVNNTVGTLVFTPAMAGGSPATEVAEAYALDNQALMRDLLRFVFSLSKTHPSLVQVRFTGSQLTLDFSGVRGLVSELLGDVRSFLDKFRPFIDADTLKQYEDPANPGSIGWYEEKLNDRFVRGADAIDSTGELEAMSRTVEESFKSLVFPGAVIDATGPRVDPDYREPYGETLCSLVFYGVANDRVEAAALATEGLIGALNTTTRPRPPAPGDRPATSTGNQVDGHLRYWTSAKGLLGDRRSIVEMFNQLVAKYLATCCDSASRKIFRGLIDSFANGSFSRAIMAGGYSLPDLVNGAATFGIRGDPTDSGVLSESLALALRRIVTDTNPTTGVSDHLVPTLVDVPSYMRENLRANLPTFAVLFDRLQSWGEFLKQVLDQTKIDVSRPYSALTVYQESFGAPPAGVKIRTGPTDVSDAASGPYVAGSTTHSVGDIASVQTKDEGVRILLLGIIDSVGGGCFSLSSAARSVLQELEDRPLYLQTKEGSIQEYKRRYGKLPLMPFSSALTYLRSRGPGESSPLLPDHNLGEVDFKMMYGTRGLLGRPESKFGLADAPGVQANLDGFNQSASAREKLDAGRYGSFLSNAAAALRFIVAVRDQNGSLVDPWAADIELTGPNPNNSVYSLRKSIQVTVALSESSAQNQNLKHISKVVGGGRSTAGLDREKERLMNIVDVNIMPINVHALMRTIPLAPLYNYSYTFEQMASLMFGRTSEEIGSVDLSGAAGAGVPPKSTRDVFLKLLFDPCAEVSNQVYGGMPQFTVGGSNGFVQRIYRGDNELGLGRPKFASDQLFNKSEFGSLVPSDYAFDEAGPAASGRLVVGGPRFQPLVATTPAPAELVADGDRVKWRDTKNNAYQGRSQPDQRVSATPQFGALTYLAEPEAGQHSSTGLKRIQLGNNTIAKMRHLELVGKARFDASISRKLFFLTNVQRVMRERIDSELSQYRTVLPEGMRIANPSVTEFGHAPVRMRSATRGRRFIGPNEVLADRTYDSDSIFPR